MNPPPPMPPSPQMMRDAEHLRMLAIFHYVMAGLSVFGMLLGGLYVAIPLILPKAFAKMPPASGSTSAPPGFPKEVMWILTLEGLVIGIISLVAVIGFYLCGRYLSARRNRTFCFVISGLACMCAPFGTVLGIFTILVLSRPTVAALFARETEGLAVPPT
ncbi:hypothetical protein KBB96_06685 [Luteolibacter ambystomatis]|uniref:Uncharacterized protein n=1 Tax=Luteolibacter ambystomatis TaxID=2824561 RepID=A0A975J225_9BACT|nr:hypothetical protein [Luteolibacter ambystomatis]QUE52574.1 hypothetical protein KBB96_06685 [Luteolibacter ambystomatis]